MVMPLKTQHLQRRRRLKWLMLGVFVVVLGAIIFFAVGGAKATEEEEAVLLTSPAERQDYLEQLGWQPAKNSGGMVEEKSQTITIPKVFDGVYTSYAQMLKEAGFDLYRYKGANAQLYSYALANWPESLGNGPVTATLVVLAGNDRLVGGDISQDEADGFSTALVSRESLESGGTEGAENAETTSKKK